MPCFVTLCWRWSMALAAVQDNGFGIKFPVPTLTEGTVCYPPKIFWITEAENWKGIGRIRGGGRSGGALEGIPYVRGPQCLPLPWRQL